jgi:hypothetical protein
MKSRFPAVLVSIGVAMLACTNVMVSSPPSPAAPPDTPAILTEIVPTVPSITPTYEGCAYVWGSQDLPELSRILNSELQAINTDATGLAYAYGENCVYGDGHSTFSAMETDFRVGIRVKNVRDEEALGDWIFRVMEVVERLPADQLAGHNPGRVDFDFKQPDPGELFLTVQIDRYRREAKGLRGAALFRLFYTNP